MAPGVSGSAGIGDFIILVGFGRSGIAEIFRYHFDAPDTPGLAGGSLGNDIEMIAGPGDSGCAGMLMIAMAAVMTRRARKGI